MSVNLNKIVTDALRRNKSGYAARQLRKVFAGAATLTFPEDTACRMGCAACCWTMPVTHSSVEREAIRIYVRENTRCSRQVLRTVPLDKLLDYCSSVARDTGHTMWSESFRAEWEMSGLPCPALMLPSGQCVIYDARPLECHLRVNPVACERPFYTGSPWANSSVPPLLMAAATHNVYDYAETDPPSRDPITVLKAGRTMHEIVTLCQQMDTRLYGKAGLSEPLAKTLSEALIG